MKCKVYIVSCDNPKVFNDFVSIIQNRIPGIKYKDYNTYKTNILSNLISRDFNLYDERDSKFLISISDQIDNYNNAVFNNLVRYISEFDYSGIYIFIRVNNIKEVNKLKRFIKRPSYKTVRIDETSDIPVKLRKEYKNYKFDSRIQYVNNNELIKQARRFMSNHVPTLKKMR